MRTGTGISGHSSIPIRDAGRYAGVLHRGILLAFLVRRSFGSAYASLSLWGCVWILWLIQGSFGPASASLHRDGSGRIRCRRVGCSGEGGETRRRRVGCSCEGGGIRRCRVGCSGQGGKQYASAEWCDMAVWEDGGVFGGDARMISGILTGRLSVSLIRLRCRRRGRLGWGLSRDYGNIPIYCIVLSNPS